MLYKEPASIYDYFIATLWSGHTKLTVSNFLIAFLPSPKIFSKLPSIVSPGEGSGHLQKKLWNLGLSVFKHRSCLTESLIAMVRILTYRFFFCRPLLGT